jgi:predicted membrane protein
MDFFFSGVFWGIVVMILGLSIVLNVVFKIHIPIFGVFIGLLVVYIGISILLGSFGIKKWSPRTGNSTDTVFNEQTIDDIKGNDYNVVFGKLNIDLRSVDLSAGTVTKEINTIFASSEIRISSSTPVKIEANAAFSGAKMPDENVASFGTYVYRSPNLDESKSFLRIKMNTVFGGSEIIVDK